MIALSALTETVSVIIPCYNAAPFVGEAIRSVLAQDWPHTEIIVVDDASADGSWEVIERYRPRIQALRLAENGGAAVARNAGAALSRGGWLMFLDADDRLSPDALRCMMETARREPGAMVHCGWRYRVREAESWVPLAPPRRVHTGDVLFDWLDGGFVPTCALLWPRAVYAATGGWDEALTLNDDGDLAMRALASGARLVRAAGGEGLYRRHGSERVSMSTDVGGEAKIRSGMRALEKVSYVLYTQGRLDAYRGPIGAAYRELALYAFRAGRSALGRECLARAGDGAGRGTGARTFGGRMLTRVLGLEGKERIAAALGRRMAGVEVAR
jgi:glycosyltransferase involved in cell wall biosynthesis